MTKCLLIGPPSGTWDTLLLLSRLIARLWSVSEHAEVFYHFQPQDDLSEASNSGDVENLRIDHVLDLSGSSYHRIETAEI